MLMSIVRFGVGAAFIIMYLYTNELYPTVVRNTALGFSVVMARLGPILCPFIIDAVDRKENVMTCFGVVLLLSSMMLVRLPETKDMPLKDSLTDDEDSIGSAGKITDV